MGNSGGKIFAKFPSLLLKRKCTLFCECHTVNHYFVCVLSQWPYSEFVSIVPNVKAPANNEFIITMKKGGKKTDSMKFSTDHRADLLTEALVCVSVVNLMHVCVVCVTEIMCGLTLDVEN